MTFCETNVTRISGALLDPCMLNDKHQRFLLPMDLWLTQVYLRSLIYSRRKLSVLDKINNCVLVPKFLSEYLLMSVWDKRIFLTQLTP